MKTALSFVVLGASLVAQSVPSLETKNPLPPVTGDMAKVATAPASKAAPADAAPQANVAAPQKAFDATSSAGANALRQEMASPDFLAVDTPRAGEHWARGTNWKAGFTAAGVEFFAAPADRSLAAPRIALHTLSATVGGKPLGLAAPAPKRDDRKVSWQRGGLVENFELRPQGIEQTFTFASLPTRGELVVTMTAEGTGEDLGNGVAFADGAIRYTEAVAIDAAGKRVAAETQFANGELTIHVPAAFVANATLPLVIDPWLSTNNIASGTVDVSNPDTVWDEGSQTWMVVYESRFAVDDTDMYAQRIGANGAPVGSTITIDVSGAVWQQPAIANLRAYGRNLIVAQVSQDDIAPFWIGGRVLDAVNNSGAFVGPQIEIERSGNPNNQNGDKLHPDVGGDPSPVTPTFFTVVWERVFSTTDHDIHMKQLEHDGTLRSDAPTSIANGTENATWPSISKSDGPSTSGQNAQYQNWAVVWQRTFNATDEDVYGALVTWDGQFKQIGGASTFPVNSSFSNDVHPKVSSPTEPLGVRRYLMVDTRTDLQNGHVYATAFDSDGTQLATRDLSTASAVVPSNWAQSYPSVDCDGIRFAVAYQDLHANSGVDQDIRAMLLESTGASIIVRDEAWVASSSQPEFNCEIASKYSSSGEHSIDYSIVDEFGTSGTFMIQSHRYVGYGVGTITTRATGCGSLTITPTGIASVGTTLQFAMNNSDPLTGVLAGLPANNTTPVCPGCILGVDGSSVLANPYFLNLPPNAGFAGITISVQGFTFGGGPCLGSVSVSDTVDLLLQ